MAIQLMRCSVQPNRARFLLDNDRYAGWVILSAYSGSFSFSLEFGGQPVGPRGVRRVASNSSGECGFGDVVLCPPGAVLYRQVISRPISFLFAEFTLSSTPRPGKATLGDVGRLRSTYYYIAETCAGSPGQRQQDALAHLVEDLLFLIRTERDRLDPPADTLMEQVAGWLKEDAFSSDLSIGALAGRIGLSPSRLTRRFRHAYGSTPMEYVTATRLARARELLLETEQTLEAIANRCGYQNAFYFSRIFRQKVGQNPSSYRRAHRV